MDLPMTSVASNQNNATTSYHHGNLREALLSAAVDSIREQGAENLSLRALARVVGVSQTAPYRHFADKNGLLVELARQTFDELSGITSDCIDPSLSSAENLLRAGEAYLRYAIANPEKYRLIFGSSITNREQYPQLRTSAHSAFNVLLQLMAEGAQRGEFLNTEPMILANNCWSSIHGFALLTIDGVFARKEQPLGFDDMLRTHLQLTLRAIQYAPQHIPQNLPGAIPFSD
ncbi:TetR/AcrR family transcriptional regulator [Thalassolituus sp. ST750PaO-4]|uniref:TetR/AcrR family transcriptional regulator n=1 Tax=Thalassolituus sp. ST750PaO-4 TaxID=2742965 RepID=UPI001CE3A791|nr:TetR/AcrR family transcriptional regulator [Thalassolituus sp. ST750PaO-4]MCA6061764.1 TetR/AcrR family transcriptional regulator [Thalassolituus sp. ST750PaO-4]